MIYCGIKISYTYSISSNLDKRRTFKVLENIPYGQERYPWNGIKEYEQNFVVECVVCQQNKGDSIEKQGSFNYYPYQANICKILQLILL